MLPSTNGLQAKDVEQVSSFLKSGCLSMWKTQQDDSSCGMTRILQTGLQVEPWRTAAGQSGMAAVPCTLAGSRRVL